MITKVWYSNFNIEMLRLYYSLFQFPVISLDIKFPGFLAIARQQDSDSERYEILRTNVNHLKIVQLGLTVSDYNGKIGGNWKFNFCDFDPVHDHQGPGSVEFLSDHGINFHEMRQIGISGLMFGLHLVNILRVHNTGKLRWVTFHGLYDIAYVLKLLSGGMPLPINLEGFAEFVGMTMGTVVDLKFMAIFCDNLDHGKLGLERLAHILNVTRIGAAHQAGADSLLTSRVFNEMMKNYIFLQCTEHLYEGVMYGIKSVRFTRQNYPHVIMPQPMNAS